MRRITKDVIEEFLILEYLELESTQSEAKNLIDKGKAHNNSVIITALQTNGRGKNVRGWVSERGDLACTIILDLSLLTFPTQLTYVAAIAVSNALELCLPHCNIRHKWVNDVLVDGLKISGILLEKYRNFILIGIGVNLMPKKSFLGIKAIGVLDLIDDLNYREFCHSLLKEFDYLRRQWQAIGFKPIKAKWLDKALNLGLEIQVVVSALTKNGIFLGLDDIGHLQLGRDGETELLCAGDVFL